MKRRDFVARVGALGAAAIAAPVVAQAYPSRVIRLVVPYPPGGGFDALARAFSDAFATEMGASVIVDNKPGASANIGTEFVARAPADGHTLLFTNEVIVVNAATFRKIPYDPLKDFTAVSTVGSTPLAIAVSRTSPIADMQQFLAAARSRTLNYGTPGQGSTLHLFGEMIAQQTGARMNHIAYKGSAPMLNDVIGGHVDVAITTLASLGPFQKAGTLRTLAIFSDARSAFLPEIPTARELGIAIEPHDTWYALFAPAGLPKPVLDRVQAATQATLRTAAYRSRLATLGYDAHGVAGNDLAALARNDLQKWNRVVAAANIPRE